MKIYKSDDLNTPVERLDLGIVLAGETKQYEFIVENDSPANLTDLSFVINNSEVEIISYPRQIKSKEKEKLVVEWSPSVTVKAGLKADLEIKGFEIYT